MALQLIIHTFRMIIGNFGQALRASVGPYLIGGLVIYLSLSGLVDQVDESGQFTGTFFVVAFVLFMLWMFVVGWVAVTWHRYILLEVQPNILPTVKGLPIWAYAWRVVKLILLVMICVLPLHLFLNVFVPTTFGGSLFVDTSQPYNPSNSILENIISVAVSIGIGFLMLRWGPSLVGTALNNPLTFRESWRATNSISGGILRVSAALVILNVVLSQIALPIYAIGPIAGDLFDLLISWITTMLGISILTTLYGHVVEDRPLVS